MGVDAARGGEGVDYSGRAEVFSGQFSGVWCVSGGVPQGGCSVGVWSGV